MTEKPERPCCSRTVPAALTEHHQHSERTTQEQDQVLRERARQAPVLAEQLQQGVAARAHFPAPPETASWPAEQVVALAEGLEPPPQPLARSDPPRSPAAPPHPHPTSRQPQQLPAPPHLTSEQRQRRAPTRQGTHH
ncbi:MAG: hypothetical protein U5N53_11990 [Mycobacterium sp.]|nr:hypothetical protein [Mycobacterium sp.]